MRLAALLAELPEEQLERLKNEHIGDDDNVSRGALCSTLESVLKSYSFVREFVGDRLPPTFSILEVLLDAPGRSTPLDGFRELVTNHSLGLIARVESGDLVARDDGLRLYRNVLIEARRNDLRLDPSETSILGVLRRELHIRAVEHFLIEHHPAFRELWGKEPAFLESITILRGSGIVFVHDGKVLLAEEVVPVVRQALGLEMPTASRRRLYGHLSGGELNEVLAGCELKTSGTREAKLDRLVASYAQPSEVLSLVSLQTLRNVCRETNATVYGSKDELVERLVQHFLHDQDLQSTPARVEAPEVVHEPEPRTLSPPRFRALFWSLKGDELSDILTSIDSRRVTGAKDVKIHLLVSSRFCEQTLLAHLTNRALEDLLYRQRLRTAGSKRERVERLVHHFATMPEHLLTADDSPPALEVALAAHAREEDETKLGGLEPPRDGHGSR